MAKSLCAISLLGQIVIFFASAHLCITNIGVRILSCFSSGKIIFFALLAFIHELVGYCQFIDFTVLNVPFLHNHISILNVSCVVVSDDKSRYEYKDDDEISLEDILDLDWTLLGQILVPL